MNDIAQPMIKQVEPIASKSADTAWVNADQGMHKPVLIAGTSNGLLVVDSEPQIELEGRPVTAIASSANHLWAIIDRNSLWHRDASGEWNKVTCVDNLRLNCILPVTSTVLVGTSEAHLLRITNGRIEHLDSFEQVKGRDQWYTPWGGPPDVRSMAVGPSGELYVNVHVGGIVRSDDQGRSWHPTIDIHADVHQVRTILAHPKMVLAATAQGLAVSQDKGNSWNFDRTNLHAAYSRAIAVGGETLLMSTSLGPQGGQAALYRRGLDEVGTFEKCKQGLPEWFPSNINTGTLSASGNLAAFGTREGQIFLSEDAGLTWQQIAADLAPIHCLYLQE